VAALRALTERLEILQIDNAAGPAGPGSRSPSGVRARTACWRCPASPKASPVTWS
jgi:hypothetical protein